MNTQIIAIANQKGGVGKTTTCANLGIGLAQAGKKVLLIDGDPQGSLTISLGNPQPDKLPFTLSDAMGKILMDQPIRPGEGILRHAEGVDLMPADIQLSGMEVSLVNAMSRETILRQYLDTLKGQYSHILIDCQPSLGMLTVNALAAANRIIIPVQAEYNIMWAIIAGLMMGPFMIPWFLGGGIIAELSMCGKNAYHDIKRVSISWVITALVRAAHGMSEIWFFRDAFLATGVSEQQVQVQTQYYTDPKYVLLSLAVTAILAVLGCMISNKLIVKHFRKSGAIK